MTLESVQGLRRTAMLVVVPKIKEVLLCGALRMEGGEGDIKRRLAMTA